MLRYVTVEKCKRRKVNGTGVPDMMNNTNDKVQPKYKSSSCSDPESGSGEFPAGQRGKSESKSKPTGGATSVPVDRKQMFVLREMKGDLFSCPSTSSLAHCISADCRMGKGIAVIFKKKFGGVNELLSQGQKPGGVATLRRGSRYIYYLVTKEKSWHKPTYETLTASLEAMQKHCQKHGIKELAMPLIGCGLDGLTWSNVCSIIRDVFRDTDITITVYSL